MKGFIHCAETRVFLDKPGDHSPNQIYCPRVVIRYTIYICWIFPLFSYDKDA